MADSGGISPMPPWPSGAVAFANGQKRPERPMIQIRDRPSFRATRQALAEITGEIALGAPGKRFATGSLPCSCAPPRPRWRSRRTPIRTFRALWFWPVGGKRPPAARHLAGRHPVRAPAPPPRPRDRTASAGVVAARPAHCSRRSRLIRTADGDPIDRVDLPCTGDVDRRSKGSGRSGLTPRRLNAARRNFWSGREESNLRPPPPERGKPKKSYINSMGCSGAVATLSRIIPRETE